MGYSHGVTKSRARLSDWHLVYMVSATLSWPTRSFPQGVHTSVLCVCVSMAAPQIKAHQDHPLRNDIACAQRSVYISPRCNFVS